MGNPVWVQEDHRRVADDSGVNGGTLLGSGNNKDRSQDKASGVTVDQTAVGAPTTAVPTSYRLLIGSEDDYLDIIGSRN